MANSHFITLEDYTRQQEDWDYKPKALCGYVWSFWEIPGNWVDFQLWYDHVAVCPSNKPSEFCEACRLLEFEHRAKKNG